jgi:bifunctional DNase/RNase
MEIPVELSRIVIRDHFEEQYIYVSEVDGTRGFPIVIGRNEAHEIRRKSLNHPTDRPMTHDLVRSILEVFDAEVAKVVINDLSNGTFYANLYLKREDEEIVLDSRPSDAIALATAFSAPLFVDDSVMEQVSKPDDDDMTL